jgi:hypothetical protein
MFLAIVDTRNNFPRKLHSLVGEKWGGGARPTHTTTKSRCTLVDTCPKSVKQQTYSQARRDRVLAYGQLGLRLGCGTHRTPRGPLISERGGRVIARYLEIVEGHPSRRRELLAAGGRPKRPPTRRQPCGMSQSDMPNLALTCDDGETTTSLSPN